MHLNVAFILAMMFVVSDDDDGDDAVSDHDDDERPLDTAAPSQFYGFSKKLLITSGTCQPIMKRMATIIMRDVLNSHFIYILIVVM